MKEAELTTIEDPPLIMHTRVSKHQKHLQFDNIQTTVWLIQRVSQLDKPLSLESSQEKAMSKHLYDQILYIRDDLEKQDCGVHQLGPASSCQLDWAWFESLSILHIVVQQIHHYWAPLSQIGMDGWNQLIHEFPYLNTQHFHNILTLIWNPSWPFIPFFDY